MSKLELTDAQWASFAAEFCKGFTTEQAGVCRTFCELRDLLPGKHVIFNLRSSKEWDEAVHAKVSVTKIIFMTTIDASRLIAERTKLYNGQAPEQYIYLDENGSPSIVSEIPLPKLPLPTNGTAALPREPWAVRTTVYRKDFSQPVSSIARFDAYAATYFDTTKNETRLNEMWARRGPEQLAKCSEMLSLRKAFPEELGGIYIAEEFKPDADEVATQPISPAVAVPLPPPVPPVNQTPATGTDTPRPRESGHSGGHLEPAVETQTIQSNKVEPVSKPDKESAKETVIAAVPGLKPASEIPAPVKRRGGRPKKEAPVSPENGQPEPAATEAEFDVEAPTAAVKQPDEQAAHAFVDSVTNFTSSEAAAAGLPEPPEFSLIPEKGSEQMKSFVRRVRDLATAGALNSDLKNYILAVGQKSETDKLTVADWKKSLDQLEAAQKEGKLKEVTKNAPLPEKF